MVQPDQVCGVRRTTPLHHIHPDVARSQDAPSSVPSPPIFHLNEPRPHAGRPGGGVVWRMVVDEHGEPEAVPLAGNGPTVKPTTAWLSDDRSSERPSRREVTPLDEVKPRVAPPPS